MPESYENNLTRIREIECTGKSYSDGIGFSPHLVVSSKVPESTKRRDQTRTVMLYEFTSRVFAFLLFRRFPPFFLVLEKDGEIKRTLSCKRTKRRDGLYVITKPVLFWCYVHAYSTVSQVIRSSFARSPAETVLCIERFEES